VAADGGAQGAAQSGSAPARVVSLNLCTDQMAHLLAAPGQLVSVSWLAYDPRSSALADQITAPPNAGSAEEIMLLAPDLVVAGRFSARATVDMLTRLDVRVEIFDPPNSFDDVRAAWRRMGMLLGRGAAAEALIADFDARLTDLRAQTGPAPRAALYYALGNTAGDATLPGEILRAAGLTNIATELGLPPFGARLPLETLVMVQPDLVLVGAPYGGHAQATELLSHPALRHLGLRRIPGGDMSCETPALLDSVAGLIALRQDWEAAQ